MNRKGFMMALVTTVLFLILIALVLNLRVSKSYVENDRAKAGDARKVLYTFDDVEEDVTNITGLRVERNGTNLTIYDQLPSTYNISNALGGYQSFIEEWYRTPEMEIVFMDGAGNPINLTELPSELVILPQNISYGYPNYGKRELLIQCEFGPCTNQNVTQLNLVFVITNASFDYAPVPGNESKYGWAPNQLGPPCGGQPEYCINFTLTVMDNQSRTYSCPGPICPYYAFRADKKSALSIQMSPCWVEIQLGEQGPPNAPTRLVEVRVHQPGNPNADCEGTFIDTQVSLNFTTMSYFLNFPSMLSVRDTNYNMSKRDAIGGLG